MEILVAVLLIVLVLGCLIGSCRPHRPTDPQAGYVEWRNNQEGE